MARAARKGRRRVAADTGSLPLQRDQAIHRAHEDRRQLCPKGQSLRRPPRLAPRPLIRMISDNLRALVAAIRAVLVTVLRANDDAARTKSGLQALAL